MRCAQALEGSGWVLPLFPGPLAQVGNSLLGSGVASSLWAVTISDSEEAGVTAEACLVGGQGTDWLYLLQPQASQVLWSQGHERVFGLLVALAGQAPEEPSCPSDPSTTLFTVGGRPLPTAVQPVLSRCAMPTAVCWFHGPPVGGASPRSILGPVIQRTLGWPWGEGEGSQGRLPSTWTR